jgi:hypothetical protein
MGGGVSGEIYQAVVLTGADPLKQGRVKVLVPQVTGASVGVWAAATTRNLDIPPAGSVVWVHLDAGDPARPVYHCAPAPWSAWAPLPGTLGTNWAVHTAQFRTGPGGQVQVRGSMQKTVSPSTAPDTMITLPGMLWPAPGAPDMWWPCSYQPGSGALGVTNILITTAGVLQQSAATITFSGGNLSLNLAPISYTTL